MRAIDFDSPGGPDVLRVLDIPEPHAGPGQVRIAVRAAPVNPSDVVTRGGLAHDRYRDVAPPYIPGWDGGYVVQPAKHAGLSAIRDAWSAPSDGRAAAADQLFGGRRQRVTGDGTGKT